MVVNQVASGTTNRYSGALSIGLPRRARIFETGALKGDCYFRAFPNRWRLRFQRLSSAAPYVVEKTEPHDLAVFYEYVV